MLSLDLHNATLFIVQLKNFTPAERLVHFLHLLASVLGSKCISGRLQISMPLHDDEIAEILGFSPRQLKRVKKRIHDEGQLQFRGAHVWSFSPDAEVPTQ